MRLLIQGLTLIQMKLINNKGLKNKFRNKLEN
jgi:hypothetical protein